MTRLALGRGMRLRGFRELFALSRTP